MHPILKTLRRSEEYRRLCAAVAESRGPVSVFGLNEAHKTHMASAIAGETGICALYIAQNEPAAISAYEDISKYNENAMLFPTRDISLAANAYAVSAEIEMRRIEVLSRLSEGAPCFIVAPIEALLQRLVRPAVLNSFIHTLRIGDSIGPDELFGSLASAGYERVDLCGERGQMARRGGYIDIFPIDAAYPVRIEFFDTDIDTMREYDPLTQRSTRNTEYIRIPPATEVPCGSLAMRAAASRMKGIDAFNEARELLEQGVMPADPLNLLPMLYQDGACLLDYLPDNAAVFFDEPPRSEESSSIAYNIFMESLSGFISQGVAHKLQAGLMFSPAEVISRLDAGKTVMLYTLNSTYNAIRPKALFSFNTRSVPRYLKVDELLRDDIIHWRRNGTAVAIFAGAHADRIGESLQEMGLDAPTAESLERGLVPGELIIVRESLPRGFEYPELHVAAITEYELFGAAKRPAPKRAKKHQLAFSELNVGDLIVHEVHGIGRFAGVETIEADGRVRDYIRLIYRDGNSLCLPTDQLDRVQRYVGTGEEPPKLSKIGSSEWQKTVSRAREGVKKLAFDLAKLYGERASRKGFSFSPDTPWQTMMESDFPYEETPDQLTCIEEIKRDMESPRVMDRLLCGDVGYGKTEVALRAVFKAVMDSKQVIFLVPTTILAQQHYNTAVSRFAGFPVRVRMLSRFTPKKEVRRTLDELESGEADVVIGTHRLLGKDVKFKDPGLFVIDEEHRFGVGHKEQIKELKKDLDVLTLSATPIPRTLHMSMTGIRDMSVIETPPEHRYPVRTFVMEYSESMVREAVLKELGRGGQVFFVYNRVQDMERFAGKLKSFMPEVRIAFAHGQMPERTLERTMIEFIEHKYDLLLCSTIIESGLDINNVNTIIIYDADKLGLAQLYQLRGRVGRGTRLAYAYLMTKSGAVLTEVAAKRLKAIGEFTQFGSGFKIAMRDLEIRGAGNILGPEQHGFMSQVGYEMYLRLIDQAVKEARGEEQREQVHCVVNIPLDANIPPKYIGRTEERMSMYRRIASIKSKGDMQDVQDELIDRYGDIPEMVQNLLDISVIKGSAEMAYITNLSVNEGEVKFAFDSGAPIDPSKLLNLAKRIKGARFFMAETPVLQIIQRNATIPNIMRSLLQIIHALADCIDSKR